MIDYVLPPIILGFIAFSGYWLVAFLSNATRHRSVGQCFAQSTALALVAAVATFAVQITVAHAQPSQKPHILTIDELMHNRVVGLAVVDKTYQPVGVVKEILRDKKRRLIAYVVKIDGTDREIALFPREFSLLIRRDPPSLSMHLLRMTDDEVREQAAMLALRGRHPLPRPRPTF